MSPERVISVQRLETRAEVADLDSAVRGYLETHPPTLGHGYSHFKKVARFSYELAEGNNFPRPETAYVCGLLHDLYRPARGGGKESHEEETVKAARELLTKTQFVWASEEVTSAILNHDELIQEGKSTPLMEILSLADKKDMSFQRAVAYSWASNRYLKGKGGIAYESFMETMRDFCLYQVKAWKVFLATKIKGVDQAAEAYMQTYEGLIQAVRGELTGRITYQDKSLELARKEAELEMKFLREAGTEKEMIRKVVHNFSELISV